MYKTRKKIALIAINVLSIIFVSAITILLIPARRSSDPSLYTLIVAGVVILATLFWGNRIKNYAISKIKSKTIETGETVLLNEFINSIRSCYSLEDFNSAIADILEKQGDCSVMLVDRSKNYILYNSPNRVTTSEVVRNKLDQYFTDAWRDGFFFFDRHIGITSNFKKARGFFLCYEQQHLYVFCRYTRLFDLDVYQRLYEEYKRFVTRTRTISTLSEISATTKEWEQLAITQQSFLPQKIPNISKLKIATYFRPLVNVSGDYFSILPIDQNKTLLMLGDVSGKGLPAALIMGLVMNTVKIIEDKEDLVGVIHAIDKAIKGMHLQDKYTVLFLSIVDTEKMSIRYINASMSDPIILSPSPDGYRIKPLTSNASLVGILDMGDVTVQEKRLFRGDTILMATDGVSEVMDDDGVELGDTDIYKKTLIAGAAKTPQEFVDDIVDLIMKYNGDKKLHDDVTMMIAKVGY
ncbi:MAG: SpoIIE family protein phosphatase [Treponema sp.]|nr:SpoIIE family protein phosphatase [Treponema sp.]